MAQGCRRVAGADAARMVFPEVDFERDCRDREAGTGPPIGGGGQWRAQRASSRALTLTLSEYLARARKVRRLSAY